MLLLVFGFYIMCFQLCVWCFLYYCLHCCCYGMFMLVLFVLLLFVVGVAVAVVAVICHDGVVAMVVY